MEMNLDGITVKLEIRGYTNMTAKARRNRAGAGWIFLYLPALAAL